MKPLMQVRGLSLKLGERRLIDGLDMDLSGGELLGILGPNGAGKTSLLRCLIGARQAQQGRVELGGRALSEWRPQARAQRLAYLAQGHQVHWPLPVREVVALGRLPHGDAHRPRGQAAVQAALQELGLLGMAEDSAQCLSGGERARVMLARALATEPEVLLADEPLAALDPAHQLHIMGLLRAQAQAGRAVALVLHDLGLAARFCTRVLVLQGGRVQADGPPAQVLDAALLARSYGVQVLDLQHEGERCLLPWRLTA
ncbi:ABC transporter [Paucibacter sp. KBW04]|uniref:ABC transporter ATP-binding protein n=1 Tax=Paucibacter sp. KBW04 TaxID=2153361 RepID=UPI000F57A215|nr:ABC transporter ATP-binding protein [Paucibacter sp. KBW04]RQO54435.1 ABC transporter [Paucibacter sp. KBW04]